ncbi:insulin-like receptor [Drosophila madeirensis]|uniref:receptor protein-tyrosine kinase n=2 Tax=Drosophila madeirensis TaxID=30013 RepID=A0AAU9F5Z8_DROMD
MFNIQEKTTSRATLTSAWEIEEDRLRFGERLFKYNYIYSDYYYSAFCNNSAIKTTNEVLATTAKTTTIGEAATTTTTTTTATTKTSTLSPSNICVLCRQQITEDTCGCCLTAVEAASPKLPTSTTGIEKDVKISMAPGCEIIVKFVRRVFKWQEYFGNDRKFECNRNVDDDDNEDNDYRDNTKNNRRLRQEHFSIYDNCHNILRTLQSLLLLMQNSAIFTKRRRRQQREQQEQREQDKEPQNQLKQKYLNYTQFLLLLETISAATTTRLSLSRSKYNKYNSIHNQQQQQLGSKRATSQVQQEKQQQQQQQRQRFHHKHQHHHHYHHHHHNGSRSRSLAWILITGLLTMHATIAMQLLPDEIYQEQPHEHLQQERHQHPYPPDDISERIELRLRRASSSSSSGRPSDQIRLSHNERTCKSMDIRNTAREFSQLSNCTIIEGFLLITLINDADHLNESYPQLTEVTEYVLVYRVNNLVSLSKVFPNLSVIRGNILFDGYALVVYSNRDLQDLGLSKLRAIANGGVRIEKNPSLCFVHTVNWLHIMAENATKSEVVLQTNRNEATCPKCPGEIKGGDVLDMNGANGGEPSVSCKEYADHKRYCWDTKSCQTICPKECRNNCIDEKTCCNKACLGGCIRDNNGHNDCISCRYLSIHNTTCVDTCPQGFYRYDRRCITAEMCEQIGTKYETKEMPLAHYNGQCTTRCPKGYQMENSTCVKCQGQCEKTCEGELIDSLVRARDFHGCTKIGPNNGLTISIKREGRSHIMEALEFGLASVHTIETYLKVHLTYGLTSLRFFKALREIRGAPMLENLYALYVLENNDLEEIWAPNQTVYIRNGGVFFHFNRKLCVSTINELRPMMASKPESFNKSEVATDSNGNRGSCGTAKILVTVEGTRPRTAFVKVDPKSVILGDPVGSNKTISNTSIFFKDPRAFIGFQFYHMIDPYGNATKSSYQPCDDRWTVSDPIKVFGHIFTDLIPYTQYAFYVRTMAISSESTNGQSDVMYFRTMPAQPSMVPAITATSVSSSEIQVTWNPPRYPYSKLTRYFVKAELTIRTAKDTPQRNYCVDPIAKAVDNEVMVAPTPAEKTPDPLTREADCKCEEGSRKTTDRDQDDRRIHAQMEFENALQNFIYVPSPKKAQGKAGAGAAAGAGAVVGLLPSANSIDDGSGPGNAIRRRRDIDFESGFERLGGSFLLRHVRALKDEPLNISQPSIVDPEAWVNETRMSALGDYYEVLGAQVLANTTSFSFKRLRHFTLYTIFVVACRERAGPNDKESICSSMNPIYKLTNRKEDADMARNLTVARENANNTQSSVRLRWLPPSDPNGDIVAYELAYRLQKPDQAEEKKCILVADFLNLTDGYPLHLNEGNYSFRVRANSLAGQGIYSDFVFIYVQPRPNYMMYLIWILGGICLMVIACLMIYVRILRMKGRPNDLHMNTDVNPFYASMQYIPDDWEVLRENIIQLSPLGQGSFGMVYEGILKSLTGGVDMECAIKTVNENATDRERTNFLSEASVMKEFDTFHVVRLLGVCSRGQPALVVMELMKKGDLKSYLRAHRPEERDEAMQAYLNRIGVTGNVHPPTYARIYQMAIEIADGMAYLAAKKFVHRDLAARNCMVAEDLTVKIGDFGMTRDVYETDYYRKGTKGLLPVRWMPPESLRDGVYSSSSDVFSFGVVLWEMATLAAQPYQGLSNEQVLRYVIDGGIMERPENCPDVLHKLMHRCWHHRPSARPSFLDIIAYLEQQCPDSEFKDVSFYHSEAGLVHREKERKERSQNDAFAAVPLDQDQEDATTPLRVGDYQGYKSNMDHNSSPNQPAESPIALVDDHATHSPFSLQSGFIVSSTPDAQSTMPTAGASHGDDASAYVQPDAEALAADRGYEIYDPSPNFAELPTSRSGSTGGGGGGGKLSGEQHLLPRKSRQPIIMSSSMPDDVIGIGGGGSSLQPSTASAASSNASSHTGTSGGGGGRYPSLKRVVADTLRNRANIFNRHLFNHKRSGSNASYKSSASNAPSTSSNSNLTSHPVAMGNLGTIESGGSGSAGSYTGTPRFYTPTATPSGGASTIISDNPNYRQLDESITSGGTTRSPGNSWSQRTDSEQATILTTSSPNPNYEMMHPPPGQGPGPGQSQSQSQGNSNSNAGANDNPNYVMMSEPELVISSNPSYAFMNAPQARLSSSDEDNDLEEDDAEDDEDEDLDVEHIKMERMPLSRPRQRAPRNPQRSRSVSQTRKSPTAAATAAAAAAAASNVSNLLKENWLRQGSSSTRPPPPNGFIGREA